MPEQPGRSRRAFAPTVLLGLASAGAAAVAGTKDAVSVDADGESSALLRAGFAQGDALAMPVVTSLALVALACWGVLLVTRGRVRRVVAWLGAVAAVGTLGVALSAWRSLHATVQDGLAQVGAEGGASITGWYLVGLVGAAASVAAAVLALRTVREWPEMGRRYDSPAGEAPAVVAEDASSLDLWKALDQGHDPTE